MKIQQLQKTLAKETVMALGTIGVMTALYVGISSWSSNRTTLKTNAESKLNQQVGELNGLREKLNNAGKNQVLFAELMQKRTEDNFIFDNARTREVLEQLVEKHRITVAGKLEYSTEEPFTLPELSNATIGFTIRRNAAVKLEAITDLHVYAFIDGLMRELPGFVVIKKLKIERKIPLDEQALAELSAGVNVNMVNADLMFDWYATDPKASTAGSAP